MGTGGGEDGADRGGEAQVAGGVLELEPRSPLMPLRSLPQALECRVEYVLADTLPKSETKYRPTACTLPDDKPL